MITHECKLGKHDYKPGHGSFISFRNKGFEMVFSLPASAWFDPTSDGPLGSDGKDWNKVGGVSFINPFKPWTWRKNSNSAMIAWRPNKTFGLFEVCAYTNDEKGRHDTSSAILVGAGVGIGATVNVARKSVKYYLQGKEHEAKINRALITTSVGPWFGGNRRSPVTHTINTIFKMK